MTNVQFQAWLQGFFELSEEDVSLDPKQIQVIINHLNLAEAVEKQLDPTNQQIRKDIDLFRSTAPHTPSEFAELTEKIRIRVLLA